MTSGRRDARFLHRSLGLTLASTHPVPGLRRVGPEAGPARVVLRWLGSAPEPAAPLRTPPWCVHPLRDEQDRPVLTVHRDAEGAYRLAYADGVRFRVRADGGAVEVRWPESYALADAAAYLVGPVLGFVRRLRGASTLHAAAAVVSGRAVALVGASGAGKSTLAAALAARGHRILCDDAACLVSDPSGGHVRVEPGAPRIGLWDDAAGALLGDAARAPRLSPTWPKRGLELVAAGRYADESAPLGLVLLLEDAPGATAPPVSPPLAPAAALMALVTHGYAAVLQDGPMRAAELARLARVAESVPVRRLQRDPGGLDALPALCQAVEGALGAAAGLAQGAAPSAAPAPASSA